MNRTPEQSKKFSKAATQRKQIIILHLTTAAATLEWLAKQPHLTPGTKRQVLEVATLCRANAK